ncbi:MAG TPA: zinc ABC transporter substrate-binding protein [Lentisphaeria bacterium]|nr:zinc ABC transporter substrate-binding protein [Lentisphaeria bacterium]
MGVQGRTMLLVLTLAAGVLSAAPLRVLVSVAPQLESVRRLGGDLVQVEALTPPGSSPETYVLNAQRMASLAQASLLFRIGAPMETALLPKLRRSYPDLAIVDARAGMRLRAMAEEGHHHGRDGHDHDAEGMDPHVWLSVANMMVHARTVGVTLAERLPEHAAVIQARTEQYVQELAKLDGRLRERLRPLSGTAVAVFHPAFGYFLESYGIEQIAVEVSGRTPSGRQLGQVLTRAQQAGVRAVYIQPQFNRRAAQAVADELRCELRVLDPLPVDYIAGLEELATALLKP